ncbi:hypothetical protein [Lentzea kentuckyensis]|uniref:hypothetical protein n=1 Tax=Lentzea kentuckyensis TaxID=360086 RepID=UPI000A3AA44D|nr:hypothetical protein [Lentzea kentuckyensis]
MSQGQPPKHDEPDDSKPDDSKPENLWRFLREGPSTWPGVIRSLVLAAGLTLLGVVVLAFVVWKGVQLEFPGVNVGPAQMFAVELLG